MLTCTMPMTTPIPFHQASTPVEYNLTTNARILAYNAAAKAVMAENPPAAYSDLYGAIVAVCGNPPYNNPNVPGSPNCSISDYDGVHYHEGGWQVLAKAAAESIKALLAGTSPQHLRQRVDRQQPPSAISCNGPNLLAAAARDKATEGHSFDKMAWTAKASAGNCSFPHSFADMHCNLAQGIPGASTAAECEAAAHAACSSATANDPRQGQSKVNAWTFTPNMPDPNQKGHCWIGMLSSL